MATILTYEEHRLLGADDIPYSGVMTVARAWRPLTRRQIRARALAALPGGPTLFDGIDAVDARTPVQIQAAQRLHNQRMHADPDYRTLYEMAIEIAHARVIQERDAHGRLQTRGYDPAIDDEPALVKFRAKSKTATPPILPARTNARRRRSTTKRTSTKSASDGPEPPQRRISVLLGPVDADACARLARLLVEQAAHEVLSRVATPNSDAVEAATPTASEEKVT